MIATVILAMIVSGAFVHGFASVTPEQRRRARAAGGVWADEDHAG